MNQEKIEAIIRNWNSSPNFIIEMLEDIQAAFGFVPHLAIQLMEKHTKLSQVRIYHLAQYPNSFMIK